MKRYARHTQIGTRVVASAAVMYLCMFAAAFGANETTSIIPLPVECELRDGSFVITSSTRVIATDAAAVEAAELADALAPAMGYRLEHVDNPSASENTVQMRIEQSLQDRLGEEGYDLEVTARAITIRAAGTAGLFYGVQTLRQLLPPAAFSRQRIDGVEWAVPCVHIVDYPRFKWRGLLIDPARHFIPVPDVKRFIDAMAMHKFNRLQIHLTDDSGLANRDPEIPRAYGDRRAGWTSPRCSSQSPGQADDSPQPGGFYTQDDIRDLVRYAADRHITLVPEIEMPAHTGRRDRVVPANSASIRRSSATLPSDQRWKANEGVLAPRPQSVAFMQDVLTEVMELFPSPYIHIGGDEANIDHWKQSEEMQTLIRELGSQGRRRNSIAGSSGRWTRS